MKGLGPMLVRGRVLQLTLVAVVLSLGLIACGGDDSSSTQAGTTGSAGSGGESSTAGEAKAGGAAAATFAEFTGGGAGEAADPGAEPVKFGFVVNQGAVPTFDEVTIAAEATVDFVNEELGGVEGHPVELKTCFVVSSEEQGQECAQEMLNDPDVALILDGVMPLGGGAFHSTIAGKKPVLMATPTTPEDATAKNAYGIAGGSFSSAGDAVYILDNLEAKSAGVLGAAADPASQQAVGRLSEALEAEGVKVTKATFSVTQTDFVGPITATGGNSNEVLYANVSAPPNCIGAAQAIKQLSITIPTLGVFTCITPPVREALGDYPTWTYRFTFENPFAPTATPGGEAFLEVMDEYEGSVDGLAAGGLAIVLTGVKFANEIGFEKLSPETFAAAAKAFKGPAPMLPPDLEYGSIPDYPALGTIASRVYTYEGDDNWVDDTDGKWLNE